MKQQKTRAKTATKAKTAKASAKTLNSRRTTVVAKKKTTQRKGLVHHSKRIYHLTPKFVHGALVGAFFGMLILTWVGSTGEANANPAPKACIKTKGPINVNLQNANVEVNTSDCNSNRTFVMKAWYAPSASGKPHEAQRIYRVTEPVVVKKNDSGWTKINVKALPEGCFYQYDLVDITDPNAPGEGNPIVRAAVGGQRDCTPHPEYSCVSMTVRQGANRSVTVDSFKVKEVNASLNKVVIFWGDAAGVGETFPGNPATIPATHQYAADGAYNIQAVAYFNITTKNTGEPTVKAASQACNAQVSFVPVAPGNQEVCEFETGNIVQVPEGTYDTSIYGPPNSDECNPTITITSTSTLTETGPGAVLFVLACAAVGGYAFHRTHHHIQHKKHRKHAAKAK